MLEACCVKPHSKSNDSTTNSPAMSNSAHHGAPYSTFPAIFAQFSSEDLVLGGGVAIFHLASERVVICSAEDHHGRKYYFLPKGRRDAGEESGRGAEREGYEEVCHFSLQRFPMSMY